MKRANLGIDDCIVRTTATIFGLKENPEDTPPPMRSELEENEYGRKRGRRLTRKEGLVER